MKLKCKMKKLIIIILIGLVLVSSAYACKRTYETNEQVIIEDEMEAEGLGADCNISIYANNTLVQSAWMVRDGYAYNYSAGTLQPDQYVAGIQCNLSNSTFKGECKFIVEGDENMYIALTFIVIGAIGFLLILGSRFDIEMLNMRTKEGFPIPIVKYLTWVVSLWLLVVLVNIGVQAVELNQPDLIAPFNALYSAVVWIVYIITFLWFLLLMYLSWLKFAGSADRLWK